VEPKPSIFKRIANSFRGEERSIFVSSSGSLRQNYVRLYGEGYAYGSDALEVAAVYACVSKIADTIASLEASVVRIGRNGSRETIEAHPVHKLISREPNAHINAYEFWQMIVSDACLHGSGYAFIDRKNQEMFYIPAVRVSHTIDQHTGEKYYAYDGAPGPVPARDILEINAFRGLNPTHQQLQNFRTAKSVQDFGAQFFDNGGMMGGILSTKEHMSPEQINQAQEMWEREYMGKHNAHKIAILGGGFQYQPLSVSLDQIQFLAVKKFTTEEIARIYSVPPAMIGLEGNTAYSNYEQQVLQFQQSTILPWVRRIEQEVERKLLSEDMELHCSFNVDTLLRADSQSRSQFYHNMVQDGIMSINEIRAKEGLGPVDGGDAHHVQLNTLPLDRMQDYADSVTNTTKEK